MAIFFTIALIEQKRKSEKQVSLKWLQFVERILQVPVALRKKSNKQRACSHEKH
jgi:hypothetical protein